MARQADFRAGLDRLVAEASRARAKGGTKGSICIMCSEREPLECHRCLLITRALAVRGLNVGHMLYDGSIEPHAATEKRLLALEGEDQDLFAPGQNERLAAAYLRRARAVAYRGKSGPRATGSGAKKARKK
jgi:hypothetical protein